MTDAALNKKPSFYEGIADQTRLERLSNGSEVLTTNLPIVKDIKTDIEVVFLGTFQKTLKHDLKKRYEAFTRVRKKGDIPWITLPAYFASPLGGPSNIIRIQNITDKDITIEFETIQPATYEVEIYFIPFVI